AEHDGNKIKPKNKDEVDHIISSLKNGNWQIIAISRKAQERKPPPPFITSTLQQEASRKLYFKVTRTMRTAQQLYEGVNLGEEGSVGLITYMRTDSTRVSDDAKKEAQKFIREKYGKEFVTEGRKGKKRPGAQEAHEAIRPTSVYLEPDKIKKYLARDQYRLYKLIWERFIASYMPPLVLDVTTVDIDCNNYLFKAQGSKVKYPGFTILYKEKTNNNNGKEDGTEAQLPPLEEGELLDLLELIPEQLFTQPPPRYTEATLIRTLEEKGIGRPSTYAPIVDTIQKREYVEIKEKRFHPTKLGFIVTELLENHFPDIVDVKFTAKMEDQLDGIEDGKADWAGVVSDFYYPFAKNLSRAEDEIKKIKIEPEVSEQVCPKCGRNLVVRKSRFGKFLACPGFPDCKYTMPFQEETGIHCPNENCDGIVILKYSRKGKKFYGCSRYPDCDFVSWYEPVEKRCEECNSFMVKKYRRDGSEYITCSNIHCPSRKRKTSKSGKKK
ncbi:MAG: type I DNA topoisomerase, partial [Candidatus Eremiobacteraeota bacterium]|nr:type I DNA topoisomerase [Candidatus Eremiobacteraeota bacterium]